MAFTMAFTILVSGSVLRGIAGGTAFLLNTESDFPIKLCLWTVPRPRKIGRHLPMLRKSFYFFALLSQASEQKKKLFPRVVPV